MKMPGEKREAVAFSYEEIKEGLLAINDDLDQFMLSASYANGTRVGEIIGISTGDIEATDEFVYLSTPVLKKRKPVLMHRAPPINRRYKRTSPRQPEPEGWLADIVLGYTVGREGKLIGYSVRTAQRRFEKYFRCTSHSFRHTRATHCFTKLGMSMRMVADYFKIAPRTLSDWVMRYGHLDRQDLEAHLR